MNTHNEYSKAIEDKNILPLIANSVGVKSPRVILSCCYGLYRDEENKPITKNEFINSLSNCGKIFIKPSVDSDSGNGCFISNFVGGFDTITNNSSEDIINSIGNNFVVQEVITCHKSVRDIFPNSVNTLRVITYKWNGNIEVMPVIMRIGRGNAFVDNAHAGGIFIAVDNDGTLHNTAFTEFCYKFYEHPDTKIKFEGYKIIGVEKVIEAAKKMHAAIPQLGSYNWDFTIGEHGEPVLIETNVNGGGIWVIEMAHGKGPFGENIESVLKWIRKMKSLNLPDRKKEFENL